MEIMIRIKIRKLEKNTIANKTPCFIQTVSFLHHRSTLELGVYQMSMQLRRCGKPYLQGRKIPDFLTCSLPLSSAALSSVIDVCAWCLSSNL